MSNRHLLLSLFSQSILNNDIYQLSDMIPGTQILYETMVETKTNKKVQSLASFLDGLKAEVKITIPFFCLLSKAE